MPFWTCIQKYTLKQSSNGPIVHIYNYSVKATQTDKPDFVHKSHHRSLAELRLCWAFEFGPPKSSLNFNDFMTDFY